MTNNLFKIAHIASAHGIRGEVKLHCFLENPRDIIHYVPLTDKQGRGYNFTITGSQKDQLIVKFEHITDRNQAELLRGVELFAGNDKRPQDDDAFYINDLVGLKAQLENGELYGTVDAVGCLICFDIIGWEDHQESMFIINFTDEGLGKGNHFRVAVGAGDFEYIASAVIYHRIDCSI